MKAYIKVIEDGSGYKAEVVSEDDYYNRGPFSRSYLSQWFLHEYEAYNEAVAWADAHRYTIVKAEDI